MTEEKPIKHKDAAKTCAYNNHGAKTIYMCADCVKQLEQSFKPTLRLVKL